MWSVPSLVRPGYQEVKCTFTCSLSILRNKTRRETSPKTTKLPDSLDLHMSYYNAILQLDVLNIIVLPYPTK
jgi:hypothetical protein